MPLPIYLKEKLSSSYTAGLVREIEHSKILLDDEQKNLAEIHPAVSGIVETDTANRNFGRITDKVIAFEMAKQRDENWHDEDKAYFDRQMDVKTAEKIQDVVEIEGGDGYKARDDYLITQGYEDYIDYRRAKIDRYMLPLENTTNALRIVINLRRKARKVIHSRSGL